MGYFDSMILEFFNRFSQRSWTFDNVIFQLTEAEFLKGGVVVAILFTLWFSCDKEGTVSETRRTVLATFAGSFLALFLAIVLANTLPFRIRPFQHPAINFRVPFGVSDRILNGWSSFPSDHATLFSGLVTGIFLISHRFGFLSIMYVVLVVLVPRVYLGFHYPTDILAGIFLGCSCVLLTSRAKIINTFTNPLIEWSERYPRLFYGAFFMLLYETAQLFDDLRAFGKSFQSLVKPIAHLYF